MSEFQKPEEKQAKFSRKQFIKAAAAVGVVAMMGKKVVESGEDDKKRLLAFEALKEQIQSESRQLFQAEGNGVSMDKLKGDRDKVPGVGTVVNREATVSLGIDKPTVSFLIGTNKETQMRIAAETRSIPTTDVAVEGEKEGKEKQVMRLIPGGTIEANLFVLTNVINNPGSYTNPTDTILPVQDTGLASDLLRLAGDVTEAMTSKYRDLSGGASGKPYTISTLDYKQIPVMIGVIYGEDGEVAGVTSPVDKARHQLIGHLIVPDTRAVGGHFDRLMLPAR